jgi:hypothetical protein
MFEQGPKPSDPGEVAFNRTIDYAFDHRALYRDSPCAVLFDDSHSPLKYPQKLVFHVSALRTVSMELLLWPPFWIPRFAFFEPTACWRFAVADFVVLLHDRPLLHRSHVV